MIAFSASCAVAPDTTNPWFIIVVNFARSSALVPYCLVALSSRAYNDAVASKLPLVCCVMLNTRSVTSASCSLGRSELASLLFTVAQASAYSETCFTERAAAKATATPDRLDIERSVLFTARVVPSNPRSIRSRRWLTRCWATRRPCMSISMS